MICNKFVQSSQVTCIAWPAEGPLVIGLVEGKIRAATVKTNKSQTLYQTDAHVVSIVSKLVKCYLHFSYFIFFVYS